MSDKKKFLIQNGNCPNCDSTNLEYASYGHFRDEYVYEFECIDCGMMGEEHYTLVFDGYSVHGNDEYYQYGDEVTEGEVDRRED